MFSQNDNLYNQLRAMIDACDRQVIDYNDKDDIAANVVDALNGIQKFLIATSPNTVLSRNQNELITPEKRKQVLDAAGRALVQLGAYKEEHDGIYQKSISIVAARLNEMSRNGDRIYTLYNQSNDLKKILETAETQKFKL